MKLILASGSQRRRELMTMCGYDYEIMVSNADESIAEQDPHEFVSKLAERKAVEVFERYSMLSGGETEICVVGADTIVVYNDEIIGKPTDKEDAERILKTLSGQTHVVYTGVAVVTAQGVQCEVSRSEVTFCTLTDAEIRDYIRSGEPMDKAGAYGIQGAFGMFVERINGNYFTIIGMPLPVLYRMLKNIGIEPKYKRID